MSCNCAISDVEIKKPPKLRVLDQHHRVGPHVSLQKTLLKTLCQDTSCKSHCVQMYLGNKTSYKIRTISEEDKKKTLDYCDRYGKSFYIHCPLIAYLDKDPKDLQDPDSKLSKSWKVVQDEVNQMNGLPTGCVLHTGTTGTISNLVNNLNDFKVPRNTHRSQKKLLLLENSAYRNGLGRDFDKLRKIFEGIDRNTIGFCLDTQHIYGAGVNSLNTHEDVVKLFDACESIYGKPDVIHLNDSKKVFGSNADRHENIGEGYIWNQDKEGLKSLLNICYEYDIDCILETPNSSKDLDNITTKYMDLETIDPGI